MKHCTLFDISNQDTYNFKFNRDTTYKCENISVTNNLSSLMFFKVLTSDFWYNIVAKKQGNISNLKQYQ